MTKLIPILSGRCLVVELPEGATNPEIHSRSLTFDTPLEVDEWGYDYQAVKIPEGNWRIIGMLSEVTDAELADVTGFYYNKYNERYVGMPTSAMRATPAGDVEDAILAEGYVFDNKLINPDDVCYFSRDRMIDDVREYHEAQSRVLDRSRCLLLGRVDG